MAGRSRTSRSKASARYRIKRVGLGSLSRFGCLLGAVVSFVPSLLLGCAGMAVLGGLLRLLESWERAEIRLLGQAIPIDVIALLNLESILRGLRMLDSLSWALFFLLVVLASGLGGLLFLVVGDLAGWIYNLVAGLSGGLEVELTKVDRPRGRRDPGREKTTPRPETR
jgi:hypothetical protein